MAKYIDENGFAHFLGKLKTLLDGKVSTESGKGLSTNDYTTAEKNKLAGIAANANNYSLPTASSSTKGGVKIGSGLGMSGEVLSIDIPNAQETSSGSGTYMSGLMSGADKAKLDGIASGANNYSLPTAGADTKGGVKIGAGLTMTGEVLSADVQSVSVMTGATPSAAGTSGIVPAPAAGSQSKVLVGGAWWGDLIAYIGSAANSPAPYTNYNRELYIGVKDASNAQYFDNGIVIPNATSSEPGFMSSADKSKLDAFGAASTYALKTDITSMYKHKGSVSSTSNLPSSGQTAGDVYNVTATGMNYVWTGSEWDALGEIFTINSMTTTEIDAAFVTAGLAAA